MLAESQVRRLLKQAETAYETRQEGNFEGWIQALRLVLEEDTYPISKEPLEERND